MKFIIILMSIISIRACILKTHNTNLNNSLAEDVKNISGLYNVTSINDMDVLSNSLTVELDHEKQNISGFSGCNQFSGNYTLDNGSLKIGPIASTRMLCQKTANKIEQAMLESLSKVDKIALEGNVLKLIHNKKNLIVATKVAQNISTVFKYSAESRGTSLEIIVNHLTISVTEDRKSKTITKPVGIDEWHELIALLKDINLDSIVNLKAPSQDRFFDGAAMANLKVIYKDSIYKTPSFDHGNPPQEIAALVKEILSISQNIE